MQLSTNGGTSFTDLSVGAQATYTGESFTFPLEIGIVKSAMNGCKYRLVGSTTESGLADPECVYFNDFTLIVTACGPLPVNLNSFTGRYSNGIAMLDWQTNQELNSDHFELFRSYDAVDFVSVAKIASAGFSNALKNYSYNDHLGSANTVYYRLKQVDKNGKETFSSIVKLSGETKSSVIIFPNPFYNNFTVTLSSAKSSVATLKKFNAAGQVVYSKVISVNKGNNSIIVSNLPSTINPGLYYVTIANDEIDFSSKL